MMLTFGFAVGGLALLMVQYCSGGKWGLLLRRPLEAMSRTLPLVFVYWLVVALSLKKLYLWAQSRRRRRAALKIGHGSTKSRPTAIDFKRPMLNPTAFIVGEPALLRHLGLLHVAAQRAGTASAMRIRPDTTPYWIKKFENISGPGIVVYAITMTAAVIYWVMSLDPTWYSSVYGLLFLVGPGLLGAGVLASLSPISLSKAEPFKTILRQTEQHDLGKLTFAFVMLNIYLAFGQFLIIWSGNLPEEIPLVSGSHSRPLGHHHHARLHLPLADSVHAAALARPQAQQEAPGAGLPVDDLRRGLRSVLADRAELQGRGAQPALQLGNSGIRGRARGDGGLLGCLTSARS